MRRTVAVDRQKKISFSGFMPTLREQLVEYYMVAAGVAALSVDADGAIGVLDVVGLDCERGLLLLCCPAGQHQRLAERAAAK